MKRNGRRCPVCQRVFGLSRQFTAAAGFDFRSGCRSCAILQSLAASFDGFFHGYTRWREAANGGEAIAVTGLAAVVVERDVHRLQPDLLDLPAREAVRCGRKFRDAEFLRVAVALGDLNAPDGFPLLMCRQVHAPNVKAVNEWVWQAVDVVRGEEIEYSFAVGLHVLQDGFDNAIRNAAIGCAG